ncbi:SDR family NAD(P)-dependent oxidoreductase [Kribbella sp. NPDC056861]|uniref:SDR family NAD(P)-dependent oxidoreductase n=1 Tax=Kribbella sp. NPDC056861 TaxID=3154857 RepID=UPI003429FD4E
MTARLDIDLAGQVAVVTGTTGGMGRVIAVELARRGAHVVTIARDPSRATTLSVEIDELPGSIELIAGDLSTRAGLSSATQTIRDRHQTINLLVNNAGAHFPDRRLSVDGLELHIAVDYLPAYAMTTLLADQLRRGCARVVNVASDTLRDTRQVKLPGPPRPPVLRTDDLRDLTRLNPAEGFVPFQAYARAKLLTVLAGYHLAREWASDGVTINAVHPGIVATGIIDDLIPTVLRPFRGIIRRTMLTPAQGAAAALRLALDPTLDGVTGRYFVRETDTATPPSSYDPAAQELLRTASDRFLQHVPRG